MIVIEYVLILRKILDKYFAMYKSATAALYFKLQSFWNDVNYVVLFNTTCGHFPAKKNNKKKT